MTRRTNVPARCWCSGGEHGPSTHRGAKHLSRCPHSDLSRTTRKYRPVHTRRLPGTRGLTVVLDR